MTKTVLINWVENDPSETEIIEDCIKVLFDESVGMWRITREEGTMLVNKDCIRYILIS